MHNGAVFISFLKFLTGEIDALPRSVQSTAQKAFVAVVALEQEYLDECYANE